MAIVSRTFPRIEVREKGLEYGPDALVVYLVLPEDSHMISGPRDYVDAMIAEMRAKPEAGSCCPVYDFTTKKEETSDVQA